MRANISLKYPFLAIHAKGGEISSPKQRTAPPPIIFKTFQNIFSIGIVFLIYFKT
jgi:hypothetical protein